MLDETVRSTEDTSALNAPPKQILDGEGEIKVDVFTSVIELNMLNSPQSLSSQSMLTGTRSKNRRERERERERWKCLTMEFARKSMV